MMTELDTDRETATDLAREALYRFLAMALSEPHGQAWRLMSDEAGQELAAEAADLLRAEAETAPAPRGFGELPPEHLDVRPLLEELPGDAGAARAEYDRVFGLVLASECPPYETEYHPASEPFYRSQQMADVAGFYRAFGLWSPGERPDHVALELEFMAFLLTKKRLTVAGSEQADVCVRAEQSFFDDHLAWWLPSFATGLKRRAGGGFYAAAATVLAALLPVERARLGVRPPRLAVQAAPAEQTDEREDSAGCTA